jgi:hypothetical protein
MSEDGRIMAPKRCLHLILAIAILASPSAAGPSLAAERLVLDRPTIVIDPDQPSYVQYALEDLASYLKDVTGCEVRTETVINRKARALIAIGPKTAQLVLAEPLPAAKLGEEGYLLKTVRKEGMTCVVATGVTSRGTKAALAALMRTIQVEGQSVLVPAGLDLLSKPAFANRGMHFNGWAFNHPYTFRSWREADWQRYLDILAYQGVNLFYLWPFMEIIPVPLSREDLAYLEECRRVVDYAQKKHGMEVWIMQCTNRVARDRCGVADPRRRPYWRPSQEDLNPGNPQHFQSIMSSREAMYRVINNVDGVCNIDSDPGYCAGSPLGDYLKVLRGCRALLDRHNLQGKQAKLVHWMWCGWGLPPGRAFDPGHQVLTIQSMRGGLAEPWGLVSGTFGYLSQCRQQGVLAKTVLLPYGVIEGEPSYPATNLNIEAVRAAMEAHLLKNRDLLGVMGNVQTPLVQLPHVYFYTSSIRDLDYCKRSERDVLLDLCGYLYPERAQFIADCYLGLKEPDPRKIDALAAQLEGLVAQDKLGRLGVFGRKLFPDHRIVAKILLLQLKLRAAQERLVLGITATTPRAECERRLQDYFDAYLAWDTAHGWHALWGWGAWPLGNLPSDPRFSAFAARLGRALGDQSAADACFGDIVRSLSARYDARIVQEGCVAPLKKALLAGN